MWKRLLLQVAALSFVYLSMVLIRHSALKSEVGGHTSMEKAIFYRYSSMVPVLWLDCVRQYLRTGQVGSKQNHF